MKSSTPTGCPCGSKQRYAACCEPLHAGELAATAEALMRSRYCAYALGLMDYVAATWHASTRPDDLHDQPGEAVRWLGLQVKAHRSLGEGKAEVEFVARYRPGGGRAVRLHETSQFVLKNGRWFYLDGEIHPK